MRKRAPFPGLLLALSLVLLSPVAWGQASVTSVPATTEQGLYCSGIITVRPISRSVSIVSGEDSLTKVAFSRGDYVYVNQGSENGVKPGEEFSVMRPVENHPKVPWFQAQPRLLNAMGQLWEDEGRVKVVSAQPAVSIAQITHSCSYIQRGDILQPFVEQPLPMLKAETHFDRFAPPSGKRKAMIVAGKWFRIESATDDIVYVNLGQGQGVKVGDYFRIFRYQTNDGDAVFQTPHMSTVLYGYGAAPRDFSWKELPREILGEGVVLRTTPNSSTVLITFSLQQIYAGDYCELE